MPFWINQHRNVHYSNVCNISVLSKPRLMEYVKNLSVDCLSGTRTTHPYTRSLTLTSSGALISAPCPISCEISSRCPLAADRCIAVLPILSFTWSCRVDLLNRILTTSEWPFSAAKWRGIEPYIGEIQALVKDGFWMRSGKQERALKPIGQNCWANALRTCSVKI